MDFWMNNKKVINKCKRKQLNLIKGSPRIRIERAYCRTVTFDCLNIPSIVKNDIIFRSKFVIEEVKYERSKRAAYVVRSQNGKKYFMKVKSKELEVKDEVEIFDKMKGKKHENVISFIDYMENDSMYFFIYEFIDGENLLEYVKKNKLNQPQIMVLFYQLLNATKFIHDNHILHCDLKLDNIMILDEQVKIVDFDLAKCCDDNMEYISESIFGTDQYIAPESYDLGIYSPKTDIWALGIIFYIIITEKYPYNESLSFEKSNSNLYRRNQFKHIDMNLLKIKINQEGYNIGLYPMICGMLKFNDEERPNIDEILEIEF